ncbi:hypothetical protein Tco_1305051 [Tanacetum coccineum]
MADLTFADSDNMVAYLEKSEANVDFAEIVDFLNASPINEAVHEERGDSMERAATTAASLYVEQDSGNINRTQSTAIPNIPFPQGISSGGSPRFQESMGDTIAQTRVLDLKNVTGAQALESIKVNRNRGIVQTEEKLNVAKDETYVDLFGIWLGTKHLVDQEEPTELVEIKVVFEKVLVLLEDKISVGIVPTRLVDDSTTNDVTLAETLMAIKSSASRPQKLKGVLFKEPSETTTITTSRPQPQIPAKDKGKGIIQEPEKPVKVKGKDQIEYDADVAQRLQAELDEEACLERKREEEEDS